MNEKLILRSELNRPLTYSEIDANFLYVANPWSPQRAYKEGMVVYHRINDKLKWFRAKVDIAPGTFNLTEWEIIGGEGDAGNGEIILIDNNNNSYNVNAIKLDDGFIFLNSTNTIKLNIDYINYLKYDSIIDGYKTSKKIFLSGFTTSDATVRLGIQGKVVIDGPLHITQNLAVTNTINGINLTNFYNTFNTHKHTILPSTYPNYAVLFPSAQSSLEDVSISNLQNGDVLSWNNTLKRWVNQPIEFNVSNLQLSSLGDIQISGLNNNNILIYDSALLKWKNIGLTLNNNTGFTQAPFQHNHDGRYYTKNELYNASINSNLIHWNAIFGAPSFALDTHNHTLISILQYSNITGSGYLYLNNNTVELANPVTGLNIIYNSNLYNLSLQSPALELISTSDILSLDISSANNSITFNLDESLLNKHHFVHFYRKHILEDQFIPYNDNILYTSYVMPYNATIQKIIVYGKNIITEDPIIEIYKNGDKINELVINEIISITDSTGLTYLNKKEQNVSLEYHQFDTLQLKLVGKVENLNVFISIQQN